MDFCLRLYSAYYELEANPDITWADFPVSEGDILLLNHHLSEGDGDEAIDLLQQSRAALFEINSGKDAVYLAPTTEIDKIMDIEVRKPPDGLDLVTK